MWKIQHTICFLLIINGLCAQDLPKLKPCPGVWINEVCWAEYNVDTPGTFANSENPYGMLYQWNRRKGWLGTGTVTGWDNSIPPSDFWASTNDPCPAGWRVPTLEEMEKLLDKSKVTSDSAAIAEGVIGKAYTDVLTGNRIFLPTSHYRQSNRPPIENDNVCIGFYWSGTAYSSSVAYSLFFERDFDGNISWPKNWGMTIRCVADCKCDTVFTDTIVTICANDLPYEWVDTIFQIGTESGIYCFQYISAVTGCDSIVTLDLHVHRDYLFTETRNACDGDTVEFRGKRLYESGTYDDLLPTVHGCDSIYRLTLNVHPVYALSLSDILCEGVPYTRNGFNVTEPGTHVLRLKTVHGCDSVVTLDLAEEKKVRGGIVLSLEDCETHGYAFFFEPDSTSGSWRWDMGDGSTYRTQEGYHTYADSGTYRVTLQLETPSGCGNEYAREQWVPYYAREVAIRTNRTAIDAETPSVRFRAEAPAGTMCRWEFGDGKTAEGVETEHVYDAEYARFYDAVLRVFNADSCVTEESVRIEVLPLPKEVNTFSPNGDGINDVFMPEFRVEIFNRNGLRVYAGEHGWDGTCRTGDAKEDTYFYKLYYRTATGDRVKTGFVVLVR